ncbi:hypothetical protein [Streptomyces murinus]|uniref:hypothetical protein n=1 Tax=Streptomyces murinus TaxID=33900 RepID=UPI0018F72B13|nr:hypothetical protein [Streptomyces murinus]
MTDAPRDFNAELLAALRATPAIRSAQIEDEDGLHVLFYRPEEDGRYADGGTLFVPRAVLNG